MKKLKFSLYGLIRVLACCGIFVGHDALAQNESSQDPHQKINAQSIVLSELLELTVRHHPAVLTQKSFVAAAQQGVINARWQYFPTPSISLQGAQASSSDPSYSGDSHVTVLALSQPLWTGGCIEAGVDKAQAYAQSANASLAESQQQLAIRVVQAYGDWLSAYRKHAAYQVGLDQHTRPIERRTLACCSTAPSFSDGGAVRLFREQLQRLGVDLARVAFRGPTGLSDMMAEYADVDIALDPVPYNGGTTSLQAMWMGVPVVTQAGHNFVSRMGASFMTAAGLPEWVADDDEGYVRVAVQMAQDRLVLLALKRGLRSRLKAQRGWDVVAHTRAMEQAFEEMVNA